MKVIIFGATGMVGQGVLRESLAAPDVSDVLTVGRTPVAEEHPKLKQVTLPDMTDYGSVEDKLAGFDACFFCLGVSSSGMSESQYTHLTHDLTLAAASTLARLNPSMVFAYVSGVGTDGSEMGRNMWARVKGRTENDLKKLAFAGVYLFRPGVIQPLGGITSKTPAYRMFYAATRPLLGLAKFLFPNALVTTSELGKAMLNAARSGGGRAVLETADIVRLASAPPFSRP